jgi:hypothetical protein
VQKGEVEPVNQWKVVGLIFLLVVGLIVTVWNRISPR